MDFSSAKWLEILLGFDAASVPDDARVQLSWTNSPRSWEVFVLLAIIIGLAYLVFYFYRREINTCPRWAKTTLAGVRVAVLMLLVIVYLGPALTYMQRRILQPTIVLMRDDSQSMKTADRYLEDAVARRVAEATGQSLQELRDARLTRADVVEMVFEKDNRQVLEEIEYKGKLRIVDFSDRVKEIETRPARIKENDTSVKQDASVKLRIGQLPALAAQGQGTDLYKAVQAGLTDPLTAAVIFVTDGQHTAAESASQSLRAVAEKASQRDIPLLILGVGDPNRPRNLQVSDVYADAQAWLDDPFEIQANLNAQGFSGETARVRLIEHKQSDSGEGVTQRDLEQRNVLIEKDAEQIRLAFTHTPKVAGRFSYTVRAEPLTGEISEEDNQPSSPIDVKVIDQQPRVLLIAGSPTWEYRALKRLLARDNAIDLSCWLQMIDPDRAQEGNTIIETLPNSREELFQYDVVVLLDPNPLEFDEAWITLLKHFVSEHAGGILYSAGPIYSGRFLGTPQTRSIRDVLPVQLGDVGSMEVASLLSSNFQAWPLGVVASDIQEPIMRFDPDTNKSLSLWKSLPGIYWSFPALQAKPTTRVLLEHTDPSLRQAEGARPLLVTGQFGAGRTVFIGFDTTWRWRKEGHDAEYFDRFWIQTTRYLVEGRAMAGKRRGTIETDKFRYEVGDRIHVTADLKDSAYEPLEIPEVRAELQTPGDVPTTMTLRQVPNQPGQYEATIIARTSGRHLISVILPDENTEGLTIETTASVSPPSAEFNEVWLNKPLLVELADASGGKYFEIDQIDELVSRIPNRQRQLDSRSKPLPLWDTSRMLILLVGLLTIEWALRKQFKLM